MARPATPPADLISRIKLETWPSGQVIHRIHPSKYGPAQFNPSDLGNARFSPIRTPASTIIPTIYGGSEFDCAAMETVFHDVPHTTGLKTVRISKIADLMYSEIECSQDLQLIDLRSVSLRKFGLERKDLIDTYASEYDYTRAWAEAFHAQCPDAQGLQWVSRQADHTYAVVLFADRIPAGSITANRPPNGLTSAPVYSSVLALATTIDVQLI